MTIHFKQACPFPPFFESGFKPLLWTLRDWWILAGLLFFAAVLRLVFFNGFFGSDDLTYLERSTQIADGVWKSADYNGALRYGYNIPAALFIYLFGLNTFTANAWTFLCSLAEIALVYFFAARYLGTRIAVFSALVLACIPLHIALATRIHADSVLAFFLTLAFALFYMAEQSSSRKLYFATGLAMGMIFWVKELALVTLLVFVSYPILVRRLNKDWLWVIGGGLAMFAAHLILMQMIAGDPLHLIKTVTGQVQTSFIQSSNGEDGAAYYFKYLFLDIKHTWLAPFFAALAMVAILFHAIKPTHPEDTHPAVSLYIVWWLLVLLAVLSFLPVSLDPFRLVMKQSNYLNLFLASIALLSGVFLARLGSRILSNALFALTLLGGIALGAMEQHAYQVFSANSKAAIAFIKTHPDDWIVGSVNNGNMARIIATLERDPALAQRFGYLSVDPHANDTDAPAVGGTSMGYAILDRETTNWGQTATRLNIAPPCWEQVVTLKPSHNSAGFGLLRMSLVVVNKLPEAMQKKLELKLLSYLEPKPATIYRVNLNRLWCGAKMSD